MSHKLQRISASALCYYTLAPRKVPTSLAVDTYYHKLAPRRAKATVSHKAQRISASAPCCYTLAPGKVPTSLAVDT